MSDEDQVRRSTHVEHEVVYAAVGASAAPDLLRFPPEGATPYAEELRLGSGADRFLIASSLLMTWGAQRGAGIQVTDIDAGDGGHYDPVVIGDDGVPQPAAEREDRFGPDGEPFLTAGTTVRLVWEDAKRADRRYRVVYIVDEPRRAGFAWGSADAEGAVGEEVFVVEHREDDTVWATVRGFVWAPAAGLLGVKGRSVVKQAVQESRDQLAALAPGGGAAAAVAAESPAVADSAEADSAAADSNMTDSTVTDGTATGSIEADSTAADDSSGD